MSFLLLRGSGSNDFASRRSGSVRWFDFTDNTFLSQTYGDNIGILPGTAADPVIDGSVLTPSGNPSLRFDILTNTGANAAGAFFMNFSTDLLTQFGENQTFYAQWLQRFDSNFCTTEILNGSNAPQNGAKQCILGAGDQPGNVLYSSCTDIEVVTETYYQTLPRVPTIYNSCTGCDAHGAFEHLVETYNVTDAKLQNSMPAPYCKYSDSGATGCATWHPDEWMVFQMGVTTGARSGNTWLNSRVQQWVGRQGQAAVQTIDWQPGVPGYFPLCAGDPATDLKFGKIWLLPYMTDKNASQVHPTMKTWYAEPIISTSPIPDPV